ncbi:type II toxin-antitoxin system RelE/ParE family toxin [Vibrio sonorensis]|uniref:type II toxin-antitoxin system RelE/ParE family toxin n=1 Tax=Vibrio sonorensis TaxID=1004316 RepID=UPI0008DA2AF7|nr:type II toxin-antitoxin system RelE/ParE family toxin [Vibrio sonorensis]
MSKNKYLLSTLAQSHLRKIRNYTVDNFSQSQWRAYKDTLTSGLQMLADNPDLGKSCHAIYPNGFYFPIGKHTVFFTKNKKHILIVAVLGQSQLPQKHLS